LVTPSARRSEASITVRFGGTQLRSRRSSVLSMCRLFRRRKQGESIIYKNGFILSTKQILDFSRPMVYAKWRFAHFSHAFGVRLQVRN
jgi:hypothetical protein